MRKTTAAEAFAENFVQLVCTTPTEIRHWKNVKLLFHFQSYPVNNWCVSYRKPDIKMFFKERPKLDSFSFFSLHFTNKTTHFSGIRTYMAGIEGKYILPRGIPIKLLQFVMKLLNRQLRIL